MGAFCSDGRDDKLAAVQNDTEQWKDQLDASKKQVKELEDKLDAKKEKDIKVDATKASPMKTALPPMESNYGTPQQELVALKLRANALEKELQHQSAHEIAPHAEEANWVEVVSPMAAGDKPPAATTVAMDGKPPLPPAKADAPPSTAPRHQSTLPAAQ